MHAHELVEETVQNRSPKCEESVVEERVDVVEFNDDDAESPQTFDRDVGEGQPLRTFDVHLQNEVARLGN